MTDLAAHYVDVCKSVGAKPNGVLEEQLRTAAAEGRAVTVLKVRNESFASKADVKALAAVLQANPHLTALSVQGGQLGDKGVKEIVRALLVHRSIERLDVAYNALEKSGLKAVCQLVQNVPALRLLDISGSFAASSLAKGELRGTLLAGTSLTYLKLGDASLDAKAVTGLLDALRQTSGLRNLHLPDNKLTGADGVQIADVLTANKTLTNVDLRYNALGNDGAAAIANALRTNTTLVGLVLWGNEITHAGCQSIASMLIHNEKLETLDLGLNDIGLRGCVALGHALAEAKSIRTLGLASTNCGNEGASAIASALKTASCPLYHLDVRRNEIGVVGIMALEVAMQANGRLRTLALVSTDDPPLSDETEISLRRKIDERCRVNTDAYRKEHGGDVDGGHAIVRGGGVDPILEADRARERAESSQRQAAMSAEPVAYSIPEATSRSRKASVAGRRSVSQTTELSYAPL